MRRLFLVMLLQWLPFGGLRAHHEPGVTVEMLDQQIAATPGISELYYQRGVELASMNLPEKAEADFKKALELKPELLPAKRQWAAMLFSQGKAPEALEMIRKAMVEVPAEHQFLLPGCHQLEGEILLGMGKPADALTALNAALDRQFPDLDTWRMRAEAQRRLGKADECIADLKAAWEKTRAIVLRNEWLEALIENGRIETALPLIESELSTSRFRSSWLIRRARCQLKLNRPELAIPDLREAVTELTSRVSVEPPPALLLCDRGLAFALLGEMEPAKADLEKARTLGASPGNLRLLVALLPKQGQN